MARKNLKWQVHEAVMDSELLPPARLLMFVFADLANAETGEIPEERKQATSLAELARRTGHGVATIKRHKPELVRLGWLIYKEPTGKQQSSHDPGSYTIAVGRNPEPGAQSEPPAGAQSEPPQEPQEGEAVAQSEPPGGSERATPVAQSEPPIKGTTNTDKNTNVKASATSADGPGAESPSEPKRKPRKAAKPKPPADPAAVERHQLAEEIVRWWWNSLAIKPAGKNAWFASVATVEALLKVGYEPRDVANALRAAGKPATIARLEIELEKHGRRPAATPGRGSNDQHLADEMEWARQLEAEEAARQEAIWEEIPA